MKRLTTAMLLILTLGGALSGCATVRGFGDDIEHLGREIEEAAEEEAAD